MKKKPLFTIMLVLALLFEVKAQPLEILDIKENGYFRVTLLGPKDVNADQATQFYYTVEDLQNRYIAGPSLSLPFNGHPGFPFRPDFKAEITSQNSGSQIYSIKYIDLLYPNGSPYLPGGSTPYVFADWEVDINFTFYYSNTVGALVATTLTLNPVVNVHFN